MDFLNGNRHLKSVQTHKVYSILEGPIEKWNIDYRKTRQSLFPLKQRKNFLVEPFPEMQLKENTTKVRLDLTNQQTNEHLNKTKRLI